MRQCYVNNRVILSLVERAFLGEISRFLAETLQPHAGSFKGRIVIKPNCNNDLNGLTGNSTDLRVLSGIIGAVKEWGHSSVIVADSPNLGIARTGANVMGRLGLQNLCKHYGVKCIDANQGGARAAKLENGIIAKVGRVFLEADTIINVPTIKSHAEMTLSCCMKNLVGISVQNSKRDIHRDIVGSIIALNKILPVQVTVVDGLMAMEGNGPGNGIPRQLNWVMVSDDTLIGDCVVSRLVGLDPFVDVPYLVRATDLGMIGESDRREINKIKPLIRIKQADKVRMFTKILGHRKMGIVRDAIRPIFDNAFVRPWLHRQGITQDIYDSAEANVTYRRLDPSQCCSHGLCEIYCPIGLSRDEILNISKGCISCGYCYWVCSGNIVAEGKFGYLAKHIKRYKLQVEQAVRISAS